MNSVSTTPMPVPVKHTAGAGTIMAFAAMCCVQLGLAASVGLTGRLGAEGVGWLRLAWAAIIIVAIARPWKIRFSRAALGMCALLGVATAGMTLCFMLAVERIPLGTASAPNSSARCPSPSFKAGEPPGGGRLLPRPACLD